MMQRREFLQAIPATASVIALGGCSKSDGVSASATGAPYINGTSPGLTYDLDSVFPKYTGYDPLVPIWNVTPDIDRCIHRFHLSSPFSPSGRYLGLTRLSREDRPPEPGEPADIVLVDLVTGEQKIIAETIGWDTQLGAQVQWGTTDQELFFNDVDSSTWMPFGVKMDPLTGDRKNLGDTVYSISPDGKWAASACLRRIGATQAGYGVIVPPEHVPVNKGAVDDDGVYVTNTVTGESRMIASYQRIVEEAVPRIDVSRYGPGDFYGFHVKWNAASERIMVVVRYMPYNDKARKPMLVTMTRNGDDIRLAIPAYYWADKGGNHPNWHPDGQHVMMNLVINEPDRRFVQARYDGADLKHMTDVPAGRGHVSLHPGERFLLTDAYANEDMGFGDGTAPLWLIDREKHQQETLVRMDALSRFFADPGETGTMRIDLHPAWDRRTHTHVAINGAENGTRRVYVADLSALVAGSA